MQPILLITAIVLFISLVANLVQRTQLHSYKHEANYQRERSQEGLDIIAELMATGSTVADDLVKALQSRQSLIFQLSQAQRNHREDQEQYESTATHLANAYAEIRHMRTTNDGLIAKLNEIEHVRIELENEEESHNHTRNQFEEILLECRALHATNSDLTTKLDEAANTINQYES